MDTKQSLVLAVMVIVALPAISIYAWQTTTFYTRDTALQAASEFVQTSPTFIWDGVDDSIHVLDVVKTHSPRAEWVISLEFTSSHSGYGDRSEQVVATVITEHVIEVTVDGDTVTSAIIDHVWDELSGAMVSYDDTAFSEAEKLGIEFLKNGPTFRFDGVPGSIEVVEIIAAESYPVQYFITLAFECKHPGYGNRAGEELAQVITSHEMKVSLSAGEIHSAIIDNQWDELILKPVSVVLVISPEPARDIVVQYIKQEYHELEGALIPHEWVVANITPQGLLGTTTLEFTGGGWRVEVHYAVVLEPIYNIFLEYVHETGFIWEGQVDHEGNILDS
jgi:hypothetical protein